MGIGHSLGLDTGSALCSLEGVRRGMDSAEDDGVGGLKWDHSDETTDLAEVNAPPTTLPVVCAMARPVETTAWLILRPLSELWMECEIRSFISATVSWPL